MPNDIRQFRKGGRNAIRPFAIRVFRFAVLLTVTAALLALLVVLSLFLIKYSTTASLVFAAISRFRLYGYLLQMSVVVILWVRWPMFVSWLIRRGIFPEDGRDILLARKRKWIGTLFAFQLVILISSTGLWR